MGANPGQETSYEGELWFDKGMKAFDQQNFSYAVECLSQAVHSCPDKLEYRKQLHRSSRRKHRQNGGISKVDSIKLAAIRSRILTAEVKQSWKSIYLLAEDAIAINPWEAPFFANLATAATHLNKYETAKYAWTSAVKLDKENASYYRTFGALLQANGEYDMARSCFSQIQSMDPTGRIADELLKSVEVDSLFNRGYQNADNARDMEVGKEAPVPREEPPEKKETPQSKAEDRLVGFITLAEDHVKSGDLSSAMKAFKNAIKLAPGNVSLQHRMEDVELSFLRERAVEAKKQAKEDPSSERKRGIATERLTEATSRELEILTRRVDDHPDDMLQVFRLADLYRRSSQLDMAAPLFEQVSNDPELCSEALIGLGECWIKTNRAEAGRIQLEKALRLIDPEQKPNSCKLAHYWLGRLYEARGYPDEADEHYGRILSLDGSFRDVAKRRLALFEQQTDV